ncbi:MAG: LLM class F420-dependent oxidoreductase, partial [Mycobacterium sp.]
MDVGIHFIDFLPGDSAQLAPTLLSTAIAAEDIGAS